MPVHFRGITEYYGPKHKVKAFVDAEHEKHFESVGMWSYNPRSRAVLLTGKDAERFMKETFGIDFPPEFMGKTKTEAKHLLRRDRAKYGELIRKLSQAKLPSYQWIRKLTTYLEARKLDGKDTEGNPIRQQRIR